MTPVNDNPFVGLRPFETEESLLFFGRQEQIMELLQKLHAHHFVAVMGSSGTGKSSLVRAGLIPRLKAGYLVNYKARWFVASMKPGHDPLLNLGLAILASCGINTKDGDNKSFLEKIREEGSEAIIERIQHTWEQENSSMFILVDQFEEIFRFAAEQSGRDEAAEFVTILLELAARTELPIYVVITMRSDFLGDCDQFYGLPEAINRSCYLVPRLNRQQLKSSIEGPAKLYGGKIHPALTSRLLNELQDKKDELPLLQHALLCIWNYEKRTDQDNELDLSDYENVGGLEKALSNHAEDGIRNMSPEDLLITKELFQALTSIDESGRMIRRPVRLSVLEKIMGVKKDRIRQVIDQINADKRAFLVINEIPGETDALIDISHESLIRNWQRLRDWVDEEAEQARNFLQLSAAASFYKQKKRDWLSESELALGLNWYKTFSPKKEWANRYAGNYDESIQYLLDSEQMARKEKGFRRKQKKKIWLTSAAALVLGLGLVSMIWLFFAARNANKKTRAIKESFQLATLALDWEKKDPTNALRLAEMAMNNNSDPGFIKIAYGIYSNNNFYKTFFQSPDSSGSVFISPSGKYIVTSNPNQQIQIFDQSGKLVDSFFSSSKLSSVGFSDDEKLVAAGCENGSIMLVELTRKGTKRTMEGHSKKVTAIFINKDAEKLISTSLDSTVRIAGVKEGSSQLFRSDDEVEGASLRADGKLLLGFGNRRPWILDIEKNELVYHYFGDHGKPLAAAYCKKGLIRNFAVSFVETDILKQETGVVKLYNDGIAHENIEFTNNILGARYRELNMKPDLIDPALTKFYMNLPVTFLLFTEDPTKNWQIIAATSDGQMNEWKSPSINNKFKEGRFLKGTLAPITSIVLAEHRIMKDARGNETSYEYLTGASNGTAKAWSYTPNSSPNESLQPVNEITAAMRKELRDFLASKALEPINPKIALSLGTRD